MTKAQHHQTIVNKNDTLSRFLSKIEIKNGCWEWTASKNENGYEYFRVNGILRRVHRITYEYYYGELNHSLEIHHICKNRKCVNPDHLEQITRRENLLKSNSPSTINAKKTHCKRGHKFTLKNTYFYKNRRCCKQCSIISIIKWKKKNG